MLLLIPGPTPIPEPVRAALAGVAVAHRAGPFEALVRSCCDDLRTIFRSSGPVLPVTGSGSVAVESAMLSLTDPAKPGTIVVCHSGKFGERWGQVADRMRDRAPRAEVAHIEAPWGEPIEPDLVAKRLRGVEDVSLVTVVHSETSTGTATDLEGVAKAVRSHAPGALLIADCITGVGTLPLHQDVWSVDVAIGASQKAFMLPPGLGFVSLGERALARLRSTSGLAPLTLDLHAWLGASETGRAPFTPPTNLFQALRVALDLMLAEGVESLWARSRRLAEATRDAARAAGLTLASSRPSDSVSCIRLPDGVGDEVRTAIRERDDIWVAGGQGPFKGRVVRLGHMGAVTPADTSRGVEALLRAIAARHAGIDADAGARVLHERLGAEATTP